MKSEEVRSALPHSHTHSHSFLSIHFTTKATAYTVAAYQDESEEARSAFLHYHPVLLIHLATQVTAYAVASSQDEERTFCFSIRSLEMPILSESSKT